MDESAKRPQKPAASAKRRWLWIGSIATLILVVAAGLWSGLSFQSKRAAIQRVMTVWNATDNEFWPQVLAGSRPKSPEAAAQQEALFSRYFGKARQIDLSGCPPEFGAAFADYIATKEQHDRSLHGPVAPGGELQNIFDTPAVASKMYEAYDRLDEIAKKYGVQLGGWGGPGSRDEVAVGPPKGVDRPGAAEVPDPKTEVYTRQLASSRCYQGSNGRMSCATCHEPGRHLQPTEVITYYRGRCLSCHRQESCTIPLAERQRVTEVDDCRSCHMPAVASAKEEAMKRTDHRLLRKR